MDARDQKVVVNLATALSVSILIDEWKSGTQD